MDFENDMAVLDASQVRMAGDVLSVKQRVARLEAVMFGAGLDESGGLRASVATLAVRMEQMTFWFRIGAWGILIILFLFGPAQIVELIKLMSHKVPVP